MPARLGTKSTALLRTAALLLGYAALIFSSSQHAHADTVSGTPAQPGAPADNGIPDPSASVVWKWLDDPNSSLVTGNPDQLANFEDPKSKIQSRMQMRIGGEVLEGALQNLRAEHVLKSVCAGKAAQSSLCKEKPEDVTKAWDAAGLGLGVPGPALLCIEGEQFKAHDADKNAKAPPPAPQSAAISAKQMSQLAQTKLKDAQEKILKMTGQFKAPTTPPKAGDVQQDDKPMSPALTTAYGKARQARILLLELESTLVGQGKHLDNCNYFDLIKVLAIKAAGASDNETRAAAKTFPVQVPAQDKSFVDGVMKCLGDGAKAVGAPEDYNKGTCQQ